MAKKNQIAIPDAVRKGILAVNQKASDKFIRRCWLAGIREHNVEVVVGLSKAFVKPIASIARYMNDGLSLERIEACFALQRDIDISVPTANYFISELNFQMENPAEVIDTMLEALGEHFMSPNRLAHMIRERFNGDVHRAYHMAIDDPEAYLRVLQGRIEWSCNDGEGRWDQGES